LGHDPPSHGYGVAGEVCPPSEFELVGERRFVGAQTYLQRLPRPAISWMECFGCQPALLL